MPRREEGAGFTESEVRSFFRDLRFRLDTIKELDQYHASQFNFFRYIHRDEDKLSNIIADMLNPKGSHGQGSLFLRLFFRTIKMSGAPNELEEAEIKREDYSQSGLIDITVRFGRAYAVGIENKPWAVEQPDQVERYCKRLEEEFNGHFVLVFLSPDGHDPTSISRGRRETLENERKLVALSYKRDLKEWLESCWKECQAEKVRWFLKDFSQYVGVMEVGRMLDNQSRKLVADYIINNPEDIEIAGLVHSVMWNDVFKSIVVTFLERLEREVRTTLGDDWQVENPRDRIRERYTAFKLSKPTWNKRYAVALEPQNNNANDFKVGVQRCEKGDKAVPTIEGLKAALDERLGEGIMTEWWEWERKVDEPYRMWGTENPTMLRRLQTDVAVLNYFKTLLQTVGEVAAGLMRPR